MRPTKVLMCEPKYFEVNYAGNEYMKSNLDKTDKENALRQWENLKSVYLQLGYEVELIDPEPGLVDMVFTANQSFPFIDEAVNKKVILSRMKNDERKKEVGYFKTFFSERNYEIIELPQSVEYFESMGDALIDYDRNIVFGGHGFRSQKTIYEILPDYTNFKVVKLNLINPFLYHLDTCLSILNTETALIVESAFDNESLDIIRNSFSDLLSIDEKDNAKLFLCNCHCPDGKNVIIQKGESISKNEIKKRGFNLIEVETSEFIKSGGSVFCMKLMFY